MDALIKPLFEERDEAKRLEGYKRANRYIAENALVIPLFQYSQPILMKRAIVFTPHLAGHVLPARMKSA